MMALLLVWTDNMDPTVRVWGMAFLAFLIYWLPALLAYKWKHNNRGAILATNFFLGWTILGWIGAFIWACTDNLEEEQPEP